MTAPVYLVLAYLMGAIPTSLWVGKAFYGVDLRTRGSGNLGATNTFRNLGWKAAVPVMAFDMFKGWFPAAWFGTLAGAPTFGWTLAFGGAAIFGHVFSVFAGFRGGKGVATSGGVFIALAPWGVLAGLLVFSVTVAVTRWVSLGSILAALALPVVVALTPHRGGMSLVWFATGLSAFVIWAHRSNIGRLLRGEESRIGGPRPAPADSDG